MSLLSEDGGSPFEWQNPNTTYDKSIFIGPKPHLDRPLGDDFNCTVIDIQPASKGDLYYKPTFIELILSLNASISAWSVACLAILHHRNSVSALIFFHLRFTPTNRHSADRSYPVLSSTSRPSLFQSNNGLQEINYSKPTTPKLLDSPC